MRVCIKLTTFDGQGDSVAWGLGCADGVTLAAREEPTRIVAMGQYRAVRVLAGSDSHYVVFMGWIRVGRK